jgi:TRAP-type C4-dicarboxylate transport system substrate-binding protein
MRRGGFRVTRRQFVWSAAAATLVAGATRSGPLRAAAPKVTWRYVAFGPKGSIFSLPYGEFARQVQERTHGEMRIDFTGGPEVIGPFQAVDAVSKGVFQMAITSSNFYATALPEGSALLSGNSLPLEAVRKSGAFAFMDKLHRERLKLRLLGSPQGGVGYVVISKEPLRKLADFQGKKFRSLPLYDPIFKALGGATVTTPPSEAYSALERGVVDGLGWTEFGIEEYRFYEHAKFILHPSFYTVRANHVVNLAAWNALPPALQKAVEEASAATDVWGATWTREQRDKELAAMQAKGTQIVTLSDAEGKRLRQIADDGLWATVERTAPKNAAKLKELFHKAMSAA